MPGDYIAYRLTGVMGTTISGLSEGILWDYTRKDIANELLDYYGIEADKLPSLLPQFGEQGLVSEQAAEALGLKAGIPVCYRAGDQPNNAYSLNVLEPGEIAATAGTSGVVYGVTDKTEYDPLSRVNAFVHVNNEQSWSAIWYPPLCEWNRQPQQLAAKECICRSDVMNRSMNWPVKLTSDQTTCFAFLLVTVQKGYCGNADPGAWMEGLQFNRHDKRHMARAAQEGIVFALQYGMEVMQEMGMKFKTIRAGHANMFLKPGLCECLRQYIRLCCRTVQYRRRAGCSKSCRCWRGYF